VQDANKMHNGLLASKTFFWFYRKLQFPRILCFACRLTSKHNWFYVWLDRDLYVITIKYKIHPCTDTLWIHKKAIWNPLDFADKRFFPMFMNETSNTKLSLFFFQTGTILYLAAWRNQWKQYIDNLGTTSMRGKYCNL